MCFPRNGQEATQIRNRGDAEQAVHDGDLDKYAELGGLEGDKARADDESGRAAQLIAPTPMDPYGALGTFYTANLPKIGVGALKKGPTAGAYDGLRIKTPGKV